MEVKTVERTFDVELDQVCFYMVQYAKVSIVGTLMPQSAAGVVELIQNNFVKRHGILFLETLRYDVVVFSPSVVILRVFYNIIFGPVVVHFILLSFPKALKDRHHPKICWIRGKVHLT